MEQTRSGYLVNMVALIAVLLVLVALGILGAVVEGLLWLVAIAVVLFVVSSIYGYIKLKGATSS